MKNLTALAICSCLVAACGSAHGAIVNAMITADNHYALFADGPDGVFMVGHNESGAGGNPGRYNWSLPESWTFDTLGDIYIAVWSDKSVAQGLLAQITLEDGTTLHTGNAAWEVTYSGFAKSTGESAPGVSEIESVVAAADLGDLWEAPYVGQGNLASTGPWGQISGITSDAKWTWGNPNGLADPLRGGNDHAEYQVFRISVVPTSGTASLAGVALLAFGRRRR